MSPFGPCFQWNARRRRESQQHTRKKNTPGSPPQPCLPRRRPPPGGSPSVLSPPPLPAASGCISSARERSVAMSGPVPNPPAHGPTPAAVPGPDCDPSARQLPVTPGRVPGAVVNQPPSTVPRAVGEPSAHEPPSDTTSAHTVNLLHLLN
jgi:hypothetical protein